MHKEFCLPRLWTTVHTAKWVSFSSPDVSSHHNLRFYQSSNSWETMKNSSLHRSLVVAPRHWQQQLTTAAQLFWPAVTAAALPHQTCHCHQSLGHQTSLQTRYLHPDQSEISIVMCQPIRDLYCVWVYTWTMLLLQHHRDCGHTMIETDQDLLDYSLSAVILLKQSESVKISF